MSRTLRFILILSISLNLLITIPSIIVFSTSTALKRTLYNSILAPKFGTPNVIFMGNSLTEGGGIWAFKIGEYNLSVWNLGHGGLTTRQLKFYADKAAGLKPKYVFIMAGINDFDKSVAGAHESFEDYKYILETIKNSGAEPIIQLTLYREEESSPDFIDALNQLLVSYANDNNIKYIDLNPLLCKHKSLLPEFTTDGVHLNDVAYEIWSERLVQFIDEHNLDI